MIRGRTLAGLECAKSGGKTLGRKEVLDNTIPSATALPTKRQMKRVWQSVTVTFVVEIYSVDFDFVGRD